MTESLKEILPKIFKDLEKKRISKEIDGAWCSAVGDKASQHSKAVGLKKKVLTVNVDSSMWIYELTLKKDRILQRLRDEGLEGIEDIRLRIGEISN